MTPELRAELNRLGVVPPPAPPAPPAPRVQRQPVDPWWKRGEECPH